MYHIEEGFLWQRNQDSHSGGNESIASHAQLGNEVKGPFAERQRRLLHPGLASIYAQLGCFPSQTPQSDCADPSLDHPNCRDCSFDFFQTAGQ